MDLMVQANALRMALQFLDEKHGIKNIIPYQPQKKLMPKEGKIKLLPRVTPEEMGIESQYLYPFIYNLGQVAKIDLHSLMILAKGRVIAESYFEGYSNEIWSITHSMCKSITVLAILFLIDEGKLKLSDRLIDLIEDGNKLTPLTHKDLTLHHLLTMSSGIVFNEIGAITSVDWAKDFMESGFRFSAGEDFNYNSMNSYMLSYLVERVSGQNISEYLRDRLFLPLQIEVYDWELSLQGIEKGGWGMYLAPEDMAKIGMLYCNKGVYQGQTVIAKELMELATRVQIEVPQSYGSYDYGYHCWVSRQGQSILLNGMFGQNVAVFPESEIVVVATAGTNEVFQQSEFFTYIRRYFQEFKPSPRPLPPNKGGLAELKGLKFQSHALVPQDSYVFPMDIKEAKRFNEEYFNGRTYEFEGEETKRVSLIPIIQQVLRNGFSEGLQALILMEENTMVFLQGEELYSVDIGFEESRLNVIKSKEESYLLSARGTWYRDEQGVLTLTCRFSFVETASSRLITLKFLGEQLHLLFDESPGREMLYQGLSSLNDELAKTKTLESLLTKIEEDVLSRPIEQLFVPEIIGNLRK